MKSKEEIIHEIIALQKEQEQTRNTIRTLEHQKNKLDLKYNLMVDVMKGKVSYHKIAKLGNDQLTALEKSYKEERDIQRTYMNKLSDLRKMNIIKKRKIENDLKDINTAGENLSLLYSQEFELRTKYHQILWRSSNVLNYFTNNNVYLSKLQASISKCAELSLSIAKSHREIEGLKSRSLNLLFASEMPIRSASENIGNIKKRLETPVSYKPSI